MDVTAAGPPSTVAQQSGKKKGKGASYSIINIFILTNLIYIFS